FVRDIIEINLSYIGPISLHAKVDDKYQYSCENKDLRVHGWICKDPTVGFWQITPSNEFRSGGLSKQNLTSHVGPYNLAMFLSAHYAGEDLVLKLQPNEPWKKVFGPIFMYLNSVSDENDPLHLWEDAKNQVFKRSSHFCKLCLCGTGTTWRRWILAKRMQADADGYFSINNIRCGSYNLYAWVPGFIGDYQHDVFITITAGCDIDLGGLVFKPPRDGPTLWEIGIPDRSSAEFYIPDPDPKYINKLYVNHPDRFRQYGLWERYADLYPDKDLVYTVGVSDYRKDWFFAQVTRKLSDDTYQGTTWQIKFKLDLVDPSGSYTLRLALATAHISELQAWTFKIIVLVNDPKTSSPLFSTGVIGHDNTIARHGIHGLYRLYNVEVPCTQLVNGNNTIFLTQTMASSDAPALQGIMYDYIRFEGPSSSNSKKQTGFV
ncbi:rhamnogalacturonate lyase, partial [Quercus suber]